MTKKALFIMGLVILILASMAFAEPIYPMCGDALEVHQNCTMMTPSLTCATANYNLTNATGGEHIEEEATMVLLNDSIYYFNFTQGRGDYVITLCDGSTREVKVMEDERKMDFLAVMVLVPLIVAGLFFYLSNKLEQPHWAVKLALIIFGLMFITMSLGVGVQVTAKYLDFPELQDIFGMTLFGYSMVYWLIVFYFIIGLMIGLITWILKLKKTDKVGKYGDGED